MRQVLIGIGFLGLVLAGCGGSDRKTAREVSGTLQAGGISGVRFTTARRNGATDVAGTFKYLPGETVTFSVGDIRLGSVPGAAVITPFTLAGLTPPTTELALRRELSRAQRMVTPFVRVANMQRLFMALDADHDPSNGYDLRNADMRLAGATIDLDQRLSDFALELAKLAPDLTHDIPLSRPVVQLYRELAVAVPAHGQTRSVTTSDFNPIPNEEFTTYAPDGARQSRGANYDDDADSESLTSWQYDSMGRITTVSSLYEPPVGLPAQIRHFTYARDERGALTGVYDEVHDDDDGLPDLRYHYVVEPDAHGFWSRQIVSLDIEVDGTPDRREEYRRQFDARHNVIAAQYEGDIDMDGVVDWRTVQAASFDADDRPLSGSQDSDEDGDGIVDARYRYSFDYGTPSTTSYEYLIDLDADGTVDVRYHTTTRFDRDRNVASVDDGYDYENDGVDEYAYRIVSTYDEQRRRLTQQRWEDYDGDGTFDTLNSDRFTYDDAGNRLSANNELDDGVDGQVDALATESFTYGAGGELLGSRFDFFAPANPEPSWGHTTVVTQTPFADGVLLLSSEYLDWGSAYVDQ
jgi:hypothetical protein